MSLADLGVCVLGGENVGRRSLIERFTGGVFGPSHDDVSEWSSTFRDRDGWTHSLLVMRPPNCTCVRDHWQVGSVAWFHFFCCGDRVFVSILMVGCQARPAGRASFGGRAVGWNYISPTT